LSAIFIVKISNMVTRRYSSKATHTWLQLGVFLVRFGSILRQKVNQSKIKTMCGLVRF